MLDHMLCVEGLDVNVGQRGLLRDIHLQCGEHGFHIVMGPVGVGKSTLMSILGARPNEDLQVTFRTLRYGGRLVDAGNHPPVIWQASREEQKLAPRSVRIVMTLIDEALRDNPAAICLDEPTASLAHDEVLPVLQRLKLESKRRAILMVTHNTEHARLVGDWITVLGGGRVIECGPVSEVFTAPKDPATKRFLKTGGMTLPRPDADVRTLAPELRGMTQLGREFAAEAMEQGLVWIIRRAFALLRPDRAQGASIQSIVALLREHEFATAIVADNGDPALRDALEASNIEIIKMSISSLTGAQAVQAGLACTKLIDARIGSGQHVVAIADEVNQAAACIAAAQLICRGLTAQDAVEIVNSKLSDAGLAMEEEQFLWDLELALDLQFVQ